MSGTRLRTRHPGRAGLALAVVGFALVLFATGRRAAPLVLIVGLALLVSAGWERSDPAAEEAAGPPPGSAPTRPAEIEARPIEPEPVVNWRAAFGLLAAFLVLWFKAETLLGFALAFTPYALERADARAVAPLRDGDLVLVDRTAVALRPGRVARLGPRRDFAGPRVAPVIAVGPAMIEPGPGTGVRIVVLDSLGRSISPADGPVVLPTGRFAVAARGGRGDTARVAMVCRMRHLRGTAIGIVFPPHHARRLP